MTGFVLFLGAKAPTGLGAILQNPLVPLVLVMVLFYFMILSPQRKREKEHRSFLDRLKKGDRVITNSGIHGEVFSVSPDQVVLEVYPKVKITFSRSAIAGALPGQATASTSSMAEAPSSSSSKKGSSSLKKKKK